MDLWSAVLDKISEKISKPSFDTWFADTNAEIDDEVIIVKAKNEFARDWLEERYKTLIFETAREMAGQTYEIEIINSDHTFKEVSPFYPKHSENTYNELKNLIMEQNRLIKDQQGKIENLEMRILELEYKFSIRVQNKV